MNRREFCASSAAAAIAAAAAGPGCPSAHAAAAGRASGEPALPALPALPANQFYKFIYDARYSAARAFGAAATRTGSAAEVAAIHGDVTQLWDGDLRGRWSAGEGAIAGMITARSLFCLAELAKDHWRRVVIRADHLRSERDQIAHRLTAPDAAVARMRDALAMADWPLHMPAALALCGSARSVARTTILLAASERGSAPTDPFLVSFVIA